MAGKIPAAKRRSARQADVADFDTIPAPLAPDTAQIDALYAAIRQLPAPERALVRATSAFNSSRKRRRSRCTATFTAPSFIPRASLSPRALPRLHPCATDAAPRDRRPAGRVNLPPHDRATQAPHRPLPCFATRRKRCRPQSATGSAQN